MKSDIHLLYFEDCPNAETARENLRVALEKIGREPKWKEVDLHSSECPPRWKGFPSPTILINNADISTGSQEAPGPTCCRLGEVPAVEVILSKIEPGSGGRLSGVSSGILASVPWCCIIPALLSLMGPGGAMAARSTAWRLNPLLLILAVLALGRAHYQIYWLGHSKPWSRYVTWGATIFVIALWLPRAFVFFG